MSNEQTAMEMYGEALDALHEATGKLATTRDDLREALDALLMAHREIEARVEAYNATGHRTQASIDREKIRVTILRKHGRDA